LLAFTAASVFTLVLGPLAVALIATFRPRGTLPFEYGPIVLDNYTKVFFDGETWALLLNTFGFAAGSLLIGVSLAIVLSLIVERTEIPCPNFLFSLVITPMAIPGIMAAVAWIFLLDPKIGFINSIIRTLSGTEMAAGPLNIYTLPGMIFVEGIRMVPTIFLMISGPFRSMDPTLEEASRTSGKSIMVTLRRVTFPLMWPAIAGAVFYYLIVVMEVFEIPGVLGLTAGVHVFSTRIYYAANPSYGIPDYGLASVLGLLLVIMSLCFMWLFYRSTKRSYKFVTITGKGFRTQRLRFGKWWTYTAFGLVILYSLIALVLPLFILIWTSLHEFYLPPSLQGLKSLSLAGYSSLAKYPGSAGAFVNTFILLCVTATTTMIISFFVAWFATHNRSGLSRALDVTSFLPHALPSIVIALTVLLVFVSFPNFIYGTVFVISIALTVRCLSYGSRAMIAGFVQIHPELIEASRVAGVGWIHTYWKIVLPLVAPAFINGWIWVGVQASRDLAAALMLYTPSSVVVSTMVWGLWETNEDSIASALGVVLIIFLVIINWCGRSAISRLRFF
jgi:iron(III) transport system permease protein